MFKCFLFHKKAKIPHHYDSYSYPSIEKLKLVNFNRVEHCMTNNYNKILSNISIMSLDTCDHVNGSYKAPHQATLG